ncbi:MAG: transporter substrate-binding domain-containing protein [Nitratireductor sp.]
MPSAPSLEFFRNARFRLCHGKSWKPPSRRAREAILAGLEITPETVSRYEFSRTYFRVPARFVVRRDEPFADTAATALRARKTGIIAGSRHAAWFVKAFRACKARHSPPARKHWMRCSRKGGCSVYRRGFAVILVAVGCVCRLLQIRRWSISFG